MAGTDDERKPLLSPSAGVDFDVAIIGAGISGINAAYRIHTGAPKGTSYAVLESRGSMGGTWDLFKYPGIRSDSDIASFSFPWKPWHDANQFLGPGEDIKKYIEEAAAENDIDKHILYHHRLISANWDSKSATWTLKVEVSSVAPSDGDAEKKTTKTEERTYRSRFIVLGTGYYNYNEALQATIPGLDNFKGEVIHPQFWPENFDYTDKNVVVIGSGATAVTLIPAMAEKAKHITMLQRSPTYIFPAPLRTPASRLISTLLLTLPLFASGLLRRALRLGNIARTYVQVLFCRAFPKVAKRVIGKAMSDKLPAHIPADPHFNPSYYPWEQRLCLSPGGDFFRALRSGKASVVTGHIAQVTETEIRLKSCPETAEPLKPDVIITATGLKLCFGGGATFTVDGQDGEDPMDLTKKAVWKASMIQDLPNVFYNIGYENASWTLGADVAAQTFVRMLHRLRKEGKKTIVPRLPAGKTVGKPLMGLSSTYLRNSSQVFPSAGEGMWAPRDNYFSDMWGAKFGDLRTDLEMS